ncbi:hypothetical protein CO115_03215 [Candidatus Falkowbacteria bacterium CG_4_9_14_3_um_filter_36_9]|uniref:Uncharacterized protein n=2 Tax=Candidatus Falkowiibacteriota TaxID=1752728 RepID=A0A1J4T424_9BACT|nr:MAG: hypothetical protein AUJ27_03510 [Candidatus Falkowbacteria bacterium CG1_02_37_44]PIV50299.1 MAG: hypothetical protein COS18_05415 [Candidatus Falkowbacteria bacterium CG02_land_8_20_14_3_00_36_14]PIX11749.1 MAG: hypothetical protein COZ73_01875 [Candidatus Falkowbacteria bacterium CG_4_8_14_3_um_filter_36_11]PJA10801.1 MAG: hypothetical protein COX67_03135 [Candidatus Falkowbacteria bacterium CG_4_10_14_0_2_um_filter_36_22]PJB19146.1 MAG: hypothetical protein CO115_03215 [Candidatus F
MSKKSYIVIAVITITIIMGDVYNNSNKKSAISLPVGENPPKKILQLKKLLEKPATLKIHNFLRLQNNMY